MQAPEYEYLDRTIIPAVAGAIGMGPNEQDQLRLAGISTMEPGSGSPVRHGRTYRATVYWQSLFVCSAELTGPELVLHSWRDTWKWIGRKVYTVEEYQEPEPEPDHARALEEIGYHLSPNNPIPDYEARQLAYDTAAAQLGWCSWAETQDEAPEVQPKATYTDADLFKMMVHDQARRWNTTPELIIAAQDLFAGKHPRTLDYLHEQKGSVTLADCIQYLIERGEP